MIDWAIRHEHSDRPACKDGVVRRTGSDELAACAEKFREVKFVKGQSLFVRGEKASSLYLVAQGRVRLAITTEDGGELSFRHTVVGEIFGEVGILDGGVRTADATALTR